MTHPPRHLALATSATALLLLAGCGAAADKVAEKATEKAIESQTGGNVDLDADDGSFTIETDEGTYSSGTGKAPDSWPDDVPLPDGLEVQVGTESDTADGRLVSIIGTVSSTPDEVLADMKDALADWEISDEVTVTGSQGATTSAQFERDGRRVTFTATAGDDGVTAITLGETTLP
ncbi:MAG: hypothetical protein KDB04_09120 [Acidimicrobiales bacterium]|nr:hypothetical protein [Acidimicrobiales bacterium]HRW36889.1 hypothetical protein [Aquihabitans sp.]